AAQGAVCGAFVNTGQDCTAATRMYVHESRFIDFTDRFLELVGQIRVGDPASQQTDMGPLVSSAQLEPVEKLVSTASPTGKFLTGGERAKVKGMEDGYFFQPTVITGVPDSANVVTDEIFGPAVVALPFKDEAEVVTRANAVRYGLAGSVWTSN